MAEKLINPQIHYNISNCSYCWLLYIVRHVKLIWKNQQPTVALNILYFQKSLRESIETPDIVITDFAKFDRPGQLHIAYQALHEYAKQNDCLPKPRNQVRIRFLLNCSICFLLITVPAELALASLSHNLILSGWGYPCVHLNASKEYRIP